MTSKSTAYRPNSSTPSSGQRSPKKEGRTLVSSSTTIKEQIKNKPYGVVQPSKKIIVKSSSDKKEKKKKVKKIKVKNINDDEDDADDEGSLRDFEYENIDGEEFEKLLASRLKIELEKKAIVKAKREALLMRLELEKIRIEEERLKKEEEEQSIKDAKIKRIEMRKKAAELKEFKKKEEEEASKLKLEQELQQARDKLQEEKDEKQRKIEEKRITRELNEKTMKEELELAKLKAKQDIIDEKNKIKIAKEEKDKELERKKIEKEEKKKSFLLKMKDGNNSETEEELDSESFYSPKIKQSSQSIQESRNDSKIIVESAITNTSSSTSLSINDIESMILKSTNKLNSSLQIQISELIDQNLHLTKTLELSNKKYEDLLKKSVASSDLLLLKEELSALKIANKSSNNDDKPDRTSSSIDNNELESLKTELLKLQEYIFNLEKSKSKKDKNNDENIAKSIEKAIKTQMELIKNQSSSTTTFASTSIDNGEIEMIRKEFIELKEIVNTNSKTETSPSSIIDQLEIIHEEINTLKENINKSNTSYDETIEFRLEQLKNQLTVPTTFSPTSIDNSEIEILRKEFIELKEIVNTNSKTESSSISIDNTQIEILCKEINELRSTSSQEFQEIRDNINKVSSTFESSIKNEKIYVKESFSSINETLQTFDTIPSSLEFLKSQLDHMKDSIKLQMVTIQDDIELLKSNIGNDAISPVTSSHLYSMDSPSSTKASRTSTKSNKDKINVISDVQYSDSDNTPLKKLQYLKLTIEDISSQRKKASKNHKNLSETMDVSDEELEQAKKLKDELTKSLDSLVKESYIQYKLAEDELDNDSPDIEENKEVILKIFNYCTGKDKESSKERKKTTRL